MPPLTDATALPATGVAELARELTAEQRAELVGFARRRLGGAPVGGGTGAGDAEDVVQEVLLRVLRRGSATRLPDRPGAYLRTAVANECVTRYRRRHELPLEDGVERPVNDHADRCTTAIAVRRALATLPPRQREILTRGFLLDHGDARIAAELGISPITVRTLRRRGLACLRDRLAA